MLSLAVTVKVMVPTTVAPLIGLVSVIVGGVVSSTAVVTVKSPDVARFPAASRESTR